VKTNIIGAASAVAIGLFLAGAANAQSVASGDNNDNNDGNNVATGSFNHSVSDLLDLYLTDNSADSHVMANQDNDKNGSYNGNLSVVANQMLKAINNNSYLDEVVDLDGEDESDTAVGYNSGSNSVNDNAFAAFAGINNLAWNSGINANTQAATNIAAQGTVNFGANGADGGAGGGGGED
jgi:hypothetical protein